MHPTLKIYNMMKKITGLFLIAGMCIFAACGTSTEKKAEEKAGNREVEIDSIQSVEEAEMERMAAEAQAEIEAQAAKNAAKKEGE